MNDLLLVGVAGFLASFVDGALGMGFGPTTSTVLLAGGLSPKSISATVNIAKVATGLAAGVSHWKFKNITWKLVMRLAIPGTLGAIVGTYVLGNVDGDKIKPYLFTLLTLVGLRIMWKFRTRIATSTATDVHAATADLKGVEAAGLAGGVTNGLIGAWGPVVTPVLLAKKVPPRYVVGSVNTAEVFVAVAAAVSLLTHLKSGDLKVGTIIALLIGGVVASPVAAYVVRFIPARALGITVASLLLFTNSQQLATWGKLGASRWIAYGAVVAITVAAAMWPRWSKTDADASGLHLVPSTAGTEPATA